MRTPRSIATRLAGASALTVALVAGTAAPASAVSLTVSLGGSSGSPQEVRADVGSAGVRSVTGAGGSPAALHRTTLWAGQPVGSQTGTAAPAAGGTVGVSGNAIESGDATGALDGSAFLMLQDVGTAEVLTNGTVGATDVLNDGAVDGDGAATLNLILGNGGSVGGGVPTLPAIPGIPSGPPATGGSDGGSPPANSQGSNSAASGTVAGTASVSGATSSSRASSSSSPTTPTVTGNPNPVITVPCSSTEGLNALVSLTGDGQAVLAEANDLTGRIAGTVIAKIGADLCTVSLNLDADSLLSLEGVNENSLSDIPLISGTGNGQDALVTVDLPNDNAMAEGLSVRVDTDATDDAPLLSIK